MKSRSESENVDKSKIENCDSIEVDLKAQDQGETPCVIEQNECVATCATATGQKHVARQPCSDGWAEAATENAEHMGRMGHHVYPD